MRPSSIWHVRTWRYALVLSCMLGEYCLGAIRTSSLAISFPTETVPRQILTSQWQSSLKQVYVHDLSGCCITFFWIVGSFLASKSIMDTSRGLYPLLIQYILLRLFICNQTVSPYIGLQHPRLARLITFCELSCVFLVFSCDSQAVISLHDERSTKECMVDS